MTFSLYDAVGGYPWTTWTSLQEAWEVAEHYRMTYSKNLKVYAALQIDTEASDTVRGHLTLGGNTAHLLNINNGKPDNLPHCCGATMDGLHGAIRSTLQSKLQFLLTPGGMEI